tara:strand:+ start:2618 stop:2839 length:222 start_codon:yes stop_codon:yes gene_type:complete
MCYDIETYCIECNIDFDEKSVVPIDIEKNIFSDRKWVAGCPECKAELYELNFAIRKFRLKRENIKKQYHEKTS